MRFNQTGRCQSQENATKEEETLCMSYPRYCSPEDEHGRNRGIASPIHIHNVARWGEHQRVNTIASCHCPANIFSAQANIISFERNNQISKGIDISVQLKRGTFDMTRSREPSGNDRDMVLYYKASSYLTLRIQPSMKTLTPAVR